VMTSFASVFFFLSFFFGGTYDADPSSTVVVLPVRAASNATMLIGDRVLEVAGTPIASWTEMAAAISQHPSSTIPIVVERLGQKVTLHVTVENDGGKGKIGVTVVRRHVELDARGATILAVTKPPAVVKEVITGIVDLVTHKGQGELVGIPRIVGETAKAVESGWPDFAFTLGIISACLGAFNMLPFPALDGGRLMFLGYEATTRKRPNPWVEQNINLLGILVLICTMVYVNVRDVLHFTK